jgi:hypothetical protein
MDIEALNVALSYPMIAGGLIAAVAGGIWLIIRLGRRSLPFPRRIVAPLVLIGLGLVAASAPPVIGRLVPIDLKERERIINGERHLTLTGWDRSDYSLLDRKPDTVVLQMANADVTDAVVARLAEYSKLRELDLSDSKVTDQALTAINGLPAIETLYLNRTAVSDVGVRTLAGHPKLKVIWLRGTAVTKDAADALKAGLPGRRVVIDPPKP